LGGCPITTAGLERSSPIWNPHPIRFLIQGDDRMFLVPDRWSASDSTLLVRLDNNVRVQFQLTNQPP